MLSAAFGRTSDNFAATAPADIPSFVPNSRRVSKPKARWTWGGEMGWFAPVPTHDCAIEPSPCAVVTHRNEPPGFDLAGFASVCLSAGPSIDGIWHRTLQSRLERARSNLHSGSQQTGYSRKTRSRTSRSEALPCSQSNHCKEYLPHRRKPQRLRELLHLPVGFDRAL